MLYLLESGNYIKVGYTKDIESLKKRMGSYRTHNPNFKLVGIKDGDKEEEKTYHIGNKEWILIPNNYNIIKEKFLIDPSLGEYKPMVSYEKLIRDYYENFDPEYEEEYPEFKLYKKYLTLKNLNSLRFNKEKALKEIEKKKEIISKICKLECKFYTNSEIKNIIGTKATVVTEYFDCIKTKVNGKEGFKLLNRKFSYTL